MIKTIYSRNLSSKNKEVQGLDPKALNLVYEPEISRTNKLLRYDFIGFDKDKTGYISLKDFKKVIRQSRMMTPKEKNLLIRSQTEEKIEYARFPEELFKVRYEIASSRLMETGIDEMHDELYHNFK